MKAASTHRERVEAAVAAGRRREPALAERATGDVAERYLAAVACFGDRDGARALALSGDPSALVRGAALLVAPLACDDAQAVEALRAAWSMRRERRLLARLRGRRRTAAIDAFLDGLAADGHLVDLVDDLAFGSEGAVRRHLARAVERPSARFWSGLASRHPSMFVELLVDRWRAAPGEGDPVTRLLTAKHHADLVERAPDAALTLAAVLLERGVDPGARVWAALARRRPAETVELAVRHASNLVSDDGGSAPKPSDPSQARLLSEGEGVLARRVRELPATLLGRIVGEAPSLLGDFGPEVRKLTPDRQRAMAEAWLAASARFPAHGTHLLKHLPAGPARDEAFARWRVAARTTSGSLPPRMLSALPVALAEIEARHQVQCVVALATDPARRFSNIARFLPWDEAEATLRDHLGHPDASARALALGELLAIPGVRADDAALPARALELVLARKFEQDPVRAAMLMTVGRWPRGVLRAEHLPAVARALRDGLDASDLSGVTAADMMALVVRCFAVDPAWAAEWLGTLVKERGTIGDANLGGRLSDAEIRVAAPHLVAVATSWGTQERGPWLSRLASGLGDRLPIAEGLPELVAKARDATPSAHFARELTHILGLYAPAVDEATLARALARFESRGWRAEIVALAAQRDERPGEHRPRRTRRWPPLPPALEDAVARVADALDTRTSPGALTVLRRRAPRRFDALVPSLLERDLSVVCLADVQAWLHRHRQDLLDLVLDAGVVRGAWATGKSRWVLSFDGGFFRWSPAQVERYAASLEAIVHDPKRDTPAAIAALSKWPRMQYADAARLIALADDARPVIQEKAIRVMARCDAGQGVPTLLACLGDRRARFAVYGLRRAVRGVLPAQALAWLAAAPRDKVTVAKEVVRLVGELRADGVFDWLDALARTSLHRDVRVALLRALWDHLDRDRAWDILGRAVDDPDWVVASRVGDIPADRLTKALDLRLSALLARLLARPEPEARLSLLRRAPFLAVADVERVVLDACRARVASPYDDEVTAAVDAVLARSTEADAPALERALDAVRTTDARAFGVAAAAICGRPIRDRASWKAAAAALEASARRDARWTSIAARAAGAHLEGEALAAALSTMHELDVDALIAARDAVRASPDERLDELGAALATSERAGVRRAAVWAVEHAARPGRGWTPPRLALLARLRADASPDVAGAAERVWPPRELAAELLKVRGGA